MSEAISSNYENGAYDGERSVMYEFLDDPIRFAWPDDQRKDGKWNYKFSSSTDLRFTELFQWERRLDFSHQSQNSIVDQFRVTDEGRREIPFKQPFAVKGVSGEDMFQNEVDIMADLRYIHVAALLGTYETPDRHYLLIFPAGCCDLLDFMSCISHQIADIPWKHRKVHASTLECHRLFRWPFEETLIQKLVRLQNFFFCLCQALKYLHDSNSRHKDIKPENIIIDLSGNVVLMDFGISKKVEATDGITDSYGPRTTIYAPKEVHDGVRRGYQSDVYSLGCVFIQMATLLLGYSLKEFWECCSRPRGGDNPPDCTLAMVPDKVEIWIDKLRASTKSSLRYQEDVQHIKSSLSTIAKMLDQNRSNRPKTDELLAVFDFQRPRCRDCNSDDKWQPSQKQKEERNAGKIERLKARLEDQEDLDHDPQDYHVPKHIAESIAASIAASSTSVLDEDTHFSDSSIRGKMVAGRGSLTSIRSRSLIESQGKVPSILRNTSLTPNATSLRPASPTKSIRPAQTSGLANLHQPARSIDNISGERRGSGEQVGPSPAQSISSEPSTPKNSPAVRFKLTPAPEEGKNREITTLPKDAEAKARAESVKRVDTADFSKKPATTTSPSTSIADAEQQGGVERTRTPPLQDGQPLAKPRSVVPSDLSKRVTQDVIPTVAMPPAIVVNRPEDVVRSDFSIDKTFGSSFDDLQRQKKRKLERRGSELVLVYDCSSKRFRKWEFAAMRGKEWSCFEVNKWKPFSLYAEKGTVSLRIAASSTQGWTHRLKRFFRIFSPGKTSRIYMTHYNTDNPPIYVQTSDGEKVFPSFTSDNPLMQSQQQIVRSENKAIGW